MKSRFYIGVVLTLTIIGVSQLQAQQPSTPAPAPQQSTPLNFTNEEVDALWKVLSARNPDYQLMLKIQQQYFSQQIASQEAHKKAQEDALDKEIKARVELEKAQEKAKSENPPPPAK